MSPPPVKAWPEAGSRGGIRRDPKGAAPLAGIPAPEWARGAVLYCVYPRALSAEGTLDRLRSRLPEIRGLGADALWILPVHPIGERGRKGRLGSPYAIRDYRRVDPALGTEDDLRHLVRDAHSLGLRVILDLVLNHAALDHPSPAPDWFHRDHLGRRTRRIRAWSDVADWNYAAAGARDYLKGAVRHWVEACDVDGYRCDVAGMVPADFWLEVREILSGLKPDHLLLAEWDDPALHRSAFHATYDWELYRHLVKAATGRVPADRLVRILARRRPAFPEGSEVLRFVENHDEPRVVTRFRGAAGGVAAFTALAGGIFLVYNGQEVGARVRPDLFDRDPIDWDPAGADRARREMRRLLEFRSACRFHGPPVVVDSGPFPRVAAYRREGPGGSSLVVALNLSGRILPLEGELRMRVGGAAPRWPEGPGGSQAPLKRLRGRSSVAWILE